MEEFIAGLPKAELHLHIEGSLTTSRMFQLAAKHNLSIGTPEEVDFNRSHYQTFDDFLVQYDASTKVILDMEDYYAVAFDYLSTCAKQNILYTEIHFCPVPYYKLGFSFADVFNTIQKASKDAFDTLGVKSNLILCVVKHFDLDMSSQMMQDSIPFKDHIVALGCAGAEVGFPASTISHLYEEGRNIGYKHFTAHTGEFGDPRCIIETLYNLKMDRIDHGVRCLEDPFLIKFLANSNIWLTVCPLSNHYLKVLDKFFDGEHIVERLLENGLKITINSDDPTLLGGFLNENYLAVAQSFKGKTEEDIKKILGQLARNSFAAAFISDEMKEEFTRKLDAYLTSSGVV